jgi:hypothetical protein
VGLIDIIRCEYELPLPEFDIEELKDFKGVVWDELDFQTYPVNPADGAIGIDEYTISEDGQIYKKTFERELVNVDGFVDLKEKETGIEKQDYTGEIVFFTNHLGKKNDYYIEFKALFWKGDLKEMKLGKWAEEDSSARKKQEKKLERSINKVKKIRSSWWGKIYLIYRSVVRGILGIFKWILALIIKLLWKMERWIT